MTDLTDAHELLIQEFEMLEHDYDRLKLAKLRGEEKARREIGELRQHLRNALAEIDELQSLLARSFVKA